jgi:hypothetical protein
VVEAIFHECIPAIISHNFIPPLRFWIGILFPCFSLASWAYDLFHMLLHSIWYNRLFYTS